MYTLHILVIEVSSTKVLEITLLFNFIKAHKLENNYIFKISNRN